MRDAEGAVPEQQCEAEFHPKYRWASTAITGASGKEVSGVESSARSRLVSDDRCNRYCTVLYGDTNMVVDVRVA